MRVKYKNPPISELAMGLYFREPIIKFRSEHVGVYWSKIKDEFPNSVQNMMIGSVQIQVPDEIFPMPRFWFMTRDNVYLIQVQRNAFIFNWRRQNEEYPHYEPLKRKLDEHFTIFQRFCEEQFSISHIDIERCELSYINLISDEQYFSSFSDTKDVVPSFEPLSFETTEKVLNSFNLSYVYSCDENIALTVSLQTRRHKETDKDVLYLELKSSGALSQHTKSEADLWFDRAHNAIGDAFNGLTNRDVQRQHWQPRED